MNSIQQNPKEYLKSLHDYQFKMDTINVRDEYKGMDRADIISSIAPKRSNFVILFEHVHGDNNCASALRNLNAFLGQEMILLGRRKWDPRAAVGCQHYEKLTRTEDYSIIQEFKQQGYKIIAAENNLESIPSFSLCDYKFQEKVLVCFGEEGKGISFKLLEMVDEIIYIPQRGTVRSLNVATASGLFIYEYTKQMGLI